MSGSEDIANIRKNTNTRTQVRNLIKEFNLSRTLSVPTETLDYSRQQISLDGLVEVTDDNTSFIGKNFIRSGYYLTFEPDIYKLQLWHKLNAPFSISIDSSLHERNGKMFGIPLPIRGPDNGLNGSVQIATGFDGLNDWVDIPHDRFIEMVKTLEGFSYHIKMAPCGIELSNGQPVTLYAKKDPTSPRGHENAILSVIMPDGSINVKLTFEGKEYTVSAPQYLAPETTTFGIEKWYDHTVIFDRIHQKLELLIDNQLFNSTPWDNPHVTPYPYLDVDWHIARNSYDNRGLFWGGLADFRFYWDLRLTYQHNYNLFTNRLSIAPIPRGQTATVGFSYITHSLDIGFIAGFLRPKPNGQGFMTGHFIFLSEPVYNDLNIVYDMFALPKVDNDLPIIYDLQYVAPVHNTLEIVYNVGEGLDDGKTSNDLLIQYDVAGTGGGGGLPQFVIGAVSDLNGSAIPSDIFNSMRQKGVEQAIIAGDMTHSADANDEIAAINKLDVSTPPAGGVLKFNIGGDFRDTPASGTNLVSDNPNIILTTGDYGIDFGVSDWCNNIMSMWKNSGIETWGALGNHDSNSYLTADFFQNNSWDWTVKKNGIAFISANTITENYQDADSRCAAAFADPNVHTIIILMHEGIWHPPNTTVSSDTVIEFHETFIKYKPKLKLVICGHTHVYGRMNPIDGVLYVMNGTGGQNASSGSTDPAPMHKINSVMHCTLNADGSITCRSVANAGQAPNPTLDTFTIGPNGELPTDGVDHRPRSSIPRRSRGRITKVMPRASAAGTNILWARGESDETALAQIKSYVGIAGTTYYKSKHVKNVYFITLDTQDPNFGTAGNTQFTWCQGRLQEAANLKASGSVTWIVVIMHKPFYNKHTATQPLNEVGGVSIWQPLFDQFQVDIVIEGHQKALEISKPLKAGNTVHGVRKSGSGEWDFSQAHGQIYAMVGGGGDTLLSSGGASTLIGFEPAFSFGRAEWDTIEGIGVDPQDNIYVVDAGLNDPQAAAVYKFTRDGQFLMKFGSYGSGQGELDTPYDVKVDPRNGHLWVADQFNDRIQEFDANGNHLSYIGPTIAGLTNPSTLYIPEVIAIDPVDYSMYISDTDNNRMIKLDANRNFVRQWGSFGTGDGQFNIPHGMALSPVNRHIYVSNHQDARIQEFDGNGNFIRKWGTEGTNVEAKQFIVPKEHISADRFGHIYQTNGDDIPYIVVFDLNGNYITKMGSATPSSAAGGLREPESSIQDSRGYCYVTSQENHRVEVFRPVYASGGGVTATETATWLYGASQYGYLLMSLDQTGRNMNLQLFNQTGTSVLYSTQISKVPTNVIPPTCPTNYHWDNQLNRCVENDPSNPPPANQPVLNISVFSDCDAGSELTSVFNQIKSKNTHQIIVCGDFTHSDAASSINAFTSAGLDNLRTNAIWCRGNHEASNEDGSSSVQTTIAQFFNVPTNTFCKKTRIQNVYIIGTDTNDSNFDSQGTQYNYVLASLQEAAALKAQGLIQWIIVAGHKPYYANSGSHHPPDEDDMVNAADVYQPLFNQYGVDFVYNGHNHTFQVSEPLTLNGAELFTLFGQAYDFTKPHGQFYINDGVCGRGNYSTDSANANYRYVNDSTQGFVFMTFDNTGLRCKVQLLSYNGTVIHSFDVVKTTSSTPPPDGGGNPPTCPTGMKWDAALGRCVDDTTTEPPPPTGGLIDSNGIKWLEATGAQGVIPQSRDQATDDRWSQNVTNIPNGYEVTGYFTFDSVGSDGHWALKHWGPNHSAPCGYEESNECCCWYDCGIRSNGDVQLQIERPHPHNEDFDIPSGAANHLYMTNIGVPMSGHCIGLKWVVYPLVVGGSASNGGMRLKMWVDTSGLLAGRPQNNWRPVYDFVDHGEILPNYKAPSEQEIECRNSDTNDRDTYAGGLHYRKR